MTPKPRSPLDATACVKSMPCRCLHLVTVGVGGAGAPDGADISFAAIQRRRPLHWPAQKFGCPRCHAADATATERRVLVAAMDLRRGSAGDGSDLSVDAAVAGVDGSVVIPLEVAETSDWLVPSTVAVAVPVTLPMIPSLRPALIGSNECRTRMRSRWWKSRSRDRSRIQSSRSRHSRGRRRQRRCQYRPRAPCPIQK